jgi:predicted dehydrogenase
MRPIIIIGAGGIVRDAHLPAYAKAGYRVDGIYDLAVPKAQELANRYSFRCFGSMDETLASVEPTTVFDVAVPADCAAGVLDRLPDGHGVLIQKPMGENLAEARAIRDICHAKGLTAAVNFQLRFAPQIALARTMIERGDIGDVIDMEARVTVFTPWHMWTFLERSPRVEILYHSVHYIDLVRSFLGDPAGVYAKSTRHPLAPRLSSTRSTIILDYGDHIRVNIETNHGHAYGPKHQESFIKWEGTRGAIRVRLGLLLDYPRGREDQFEYVILEESREPEWRTMAVQGSWFPDAFIYSMGSLLSFLDGSVPTLPTSVDDAYRTMAVVEAAYNSSDGGGTRVNYD